MLTAKSDYKETLIKAIIVSLTLAIILSVVYSLRNVAFATHDDLDAYLKVRSLSFSDFMSDSVTSMLERGRISPVQIVGNIIQYVVLSSGSKYMYVMLMYVPIIINVVFFAYIIEKHANKYLGVLIPAFFFTYVQIDNNHNLMISYPLNFQLGFMMFLLSIFLYFKYTQLKKSRYLWLSALCMFDSFSAYESFVTYFAVFFILFLLNNTAYKDKKLHFNVKGFLKQIKFHFAATIIYFAIYLCFRYFGGFDYGGATIDSSSFSFKLAIKTLFTFSFSLFPLREFFQDGFASVFSLSQVNALMVFKAIAASAAFCFILIKSRKIELRKLLAVICISLVAGIVFCIPHSLTPQYQTWVSWGVSGFAPSYFSYYWIVLSLSSIFVYISNVCSKLKPVMIILLCIVVFIGSIATDFSNKATIDTKERDTVRYKMFDRLVSSSYYDTLEEGAAIYVKGYVGIHLNLSSLAAYGSIYSEGKYHFLDNISDVMSYEHKYFLWYDESSQSIYLGKVKTEGVGDEVFVMSYSFNKYNDTFYAKKSMDIGEVYINGQKQGQFADTLVLPVPSSENGFLVRADSILLETCKLMSRSDIPTDQDIFTAPIE